MEGEEMEVELVEEFNPQPEITGFNNPGGYMPRRNSLCNYNEWE